MKKKLSIIILSTFALLASCGGNTNQSSQSTSNSEESSSTSESSVSQSSSETRVCEDDNKVHLYILTGQSGARGKAINTDLTDEQKEENYDVDICADGLMMPNLNKIPEELSGDAELKILKPGFGDSVAEFGPELGMGETLASRFPKDGASRRSVIVKYTACGSTFTDHWYTTSMLDDETISDKLNVNQIRTNPVNDQLTGPLTNNLYQIISSTIDQVVAEGFEPVIDGAVFIHGEQDAKFDTNMEIYEKALEYFIKDLREYIDTNLSTYVKESNIPVVITQALTNSAKYSNTLRDIQKRVAEKMEKTSFVDAEGLYTNTFEPWHLGTESNMVLGNRVIAELLSNGNDTRVVESFEELNINVPQGADINLPKYVKANFDNGYQGYIKVEYTSTYNKDQLGEQTVNFKAETSCNTFNGSLTVNVNNEPYIDGVMNEYASVKKNVMEGIGDLYVVKGEEGLYVGAKITDDDLWTDGEAWKTGDMGQKEQNDDFRVYIACEDYEEPAIACLSAANLLRGYDSGTDFSQTNALANNNSVFKKFWTGYKYRVTTKGLANVEEGGQSQGLELELYLTYDDLGISNPDSIKLLFNYNNVTKKTGKKTNADNYYTATNVTTGTPESDINNYFAINQLI